MSVTLAPPSGQRAARRVATAWLENQAAGVLATAAVTPLLHEAGCPPALATYLWYRAELRDQERQIQRWLERRVAAVDGRCGQKAAA